MPKAKQNGEILIKDALPSLVVGETIFTNGDGSFASSEFFVGTIYAINGTEISINRVDGERGEGVDRTWLIDATEGNDAVIVYMDEEHATFRPFNKLKFGNVIKFEGTSGSMPIIPTGHMIILQVITEPKSLLVNTFAPSHPITIPISNTAIKFKYYFDFVKHQKCVAHESCKNLVAHYVDGYFLCAEHKHALGRVIHCHDCAQEVLEANTTLRAIRGNTTRVRMCRSCAQIRSDNERVIKEHSFKPAPIFISVDPIDETLTNKIFTGIENEIECPARYTPEVNDREKLGSIVQTLSTLIIEKCNIPSPWFYLKSDGSLTNGFELVTHPATLKGHASLPWKHLTDLYKSYGIRADDTTTCGLHIHASKSSMNDVHQQKLGYFIYKNQAFMEKIARRDDCEYATYRNRRDFPLEQMAQNLRIKYEALNWSPPDTVEFRMFKGSVDYETLMSSIEFVHAAIMFTSHVPVTTLKVTSKCLPAFRTYVAESDYKFLTKYLTEKGTI